MPASSATIFAAIPAAVPATIPAIAAIPSDSTTAEFAAIPSIACCAACSACSSGTNGGGSGIAECRCVAGRCDREDGASVVASDDG